ncbi:MAG: T9SS type A sorting domain-containing protein, partial [Flavobacteriales bacterium]|nr:T9SS type A sorting domain-containing protein [Flavobacteriales bacterium]
DERADDLEDLATEPIQDHIEMGYSGLNGDPDINDLIAELEALDYYDELFTFVYGDNTITEDRISNALAQFIRSIESYDSKFDIGYALVDGGPFGENLHMDFPNFTPAENLGKELFITDAIKNASGARIGGGVGCNRCHKAPSFTFSSGGKNNGVTTEIDGTEVFDITKAPSLRDVFNPNGSLNGPLFHNGQASTFEELLDHYNDVPPGPDLDLRINVNGIPLNLASEEIPHLKEFIKTLTGTDIYTNEKWSDPFDENGDVQIVGGPTGLNEHERFDGLSLYPNPASDHVTIAGLAPGTCYAEVRSLSSEIVWEGILTDAQSIDLNGLAAGVYVITLRDPMSSASAKRKFIKR